MPCSGFAEGMSFDGPSPMLLLLLLSRESIWKDLGSSSQLGLIALIQGSSASTVFPGFRYSTHCNTSYPSLLTSYLDGWEEHLGLICRAPLAGFLMHYLQAIKWYRDWRMSAQKTPCHSPSGIDYTSLMGIMTRFVYNLKFLNGSVYCQPSEASEPQSQLQRGHDMFLFQHISLPTNIPIYHFCITQNGTKLLNLSSETKRENHPVHYCYERRIKWL